MLNHYETPPFGIIFFELFPSILSQQIQATRRWFNCSFTFLSSQIGGRFDSQFDCWNIFCRLKKNPTPIFCRNMAKHLHGPKKPNSRDPKKSHSFGRMHFLFNDKKGLFVSPAVGLSGVKTKIPSWTNLKTTRPKFGRRRGERPFLLDVSWEKKLSGA